MEGPLIEAAPAADGTSRRLDSRWVAYRRTTGMIRTLILALLAAAAAIIFVTTLGADPVIAALVAAALVLPVGALLFAWPAVAYRHTTWRMGARALEIRRGVLWRKVIDVPRSRIQHSDVSQGPIERRYGLATFSVFTAGTRYAGVSLGGLAHEDALALRAQMQSDDDDVV